MELVKERVDALFKNAQPHGKILPRRRLDNPVIDGGAVSARILVDDAVAHRSDSGIKS